MIHRSIFICQDGNFLFRRVPCVRRSVVTLACNSDDLQICAHSASLFDAGAKKWAPNHTYIRLIMSMMMPCFTQLPTSKKLLYLFTYIDPQLFPNHHQQTKKWSVTILERKRSSFDTGRKTASSIETGMVMNWVPVYVELCRAPFCNKKITIPTFFVDQS